MFFFEGPYHVSAIKVENFSRLSAKAVEDNVGFFFVSLVGEAW